MAEDAERVPVSTYVPAHQRDRWRADADRLGMSQSEFVRSMVQAGRRGFTIEGRGGDGPEADIGASNPRGNDLKTALLELLREDGPLEWGEIVRELTADLEDDVEDALVELQDENLVRHSGRRGGYRMAGGSDGE